MLSRFALDTEGNLWVGGYSEPYLGTLYEHDGTSWQNRTPLPIGEGAVYVNADSAGNVWALVVEPKYPPSTAKLIQYADTSAIVHTELELAAFFQVSMSTGRDSTFWIATGAADYGDIEIAPRLSVYADGGWTHYSDPPFGDRPGPMAVDGYGHVWMGSRSVYDEHGHRAPEGLFRFDGTSWSLYDTTSTPLPSNSVMALAVEDKDILWIGTDRGLVRFDGSNWTVYNTVKSGLPDDYITAIKVDPEGNKWIATVAPGEDFTPGTLAVFRAGGVVGVGVEEPGVAPEAEVSVAVYPNPFSAEATLAYTLPRAEAVSVRVYDVVGREVATLAEELETAGRHMVVLHGDRLGAGMYLVRLRVGERTFVRRVALVR